jgi:branched-chain amino acid transport system substrate-binding protein
MMRRNAGDTVVFSKLIQGGIKVKRYPVILLSSLIIMLLMAACAGATPAATEAPKPTEAATAEPTTAPTEAAPEEVTLKLGFTSSQTGAQNVASTGQTNGINLWLDAVNKDGIKVGNKIVKFETVNYDDESTADRVQQLYTKLATEDKVDLMISPYSSGLADAAAVISEQYSKIMVTTGAASEGTYKKGYTHVFQAYTPASHYLTPALDLLAKQDPTAKKIAIVHENDKFSSDVAKAAEDYAKANGFEVVMSEGYDTGTTDFGPFINKIQAAAPDAIIGGGHFADGSTFAKQLAEKKIAVKFVALLVAPPEPKFADLGDAAFGIIGPSQWEPGVTYSADAAKTMNIPFYGPTVQEFTDAYKAKYSADPSYHGAGGYAAGLLLQKALEDAGSTDPEALKAALDKMDIMTFFGHLSFNTTAEAHGLQTGHSMVLMQWQKDGDTLVKKIIWPEDAATAAALYPKP